MSIIERLRRFAACPRGNSAMEYVLFLALIGVVAAFGFGELQTNGLEGTLDSISTAVEDAG